ncbi:hypothetical protein BUALT_Bualt17G0006400 [Buddleja alternifolia]|uniref:Retrotransposon gag domain-containing protein n=1 Tax=Buddleja alternifolia TaxID=168488 RepID=A0AAV6WFS2_9LAMI|nr:hypothetical protein BUALT_Bualt17G0006400 [Buddleja alternifolia]
MIEKSSYQLVSEPSILAFDGSNTMAEQIETEVLRKDVEQLKEQFRRNSEKLDRSLEELRQTIGMLSSNNRIRHTSQCNFSFLQKARYESPTKCLKYELPKFYGENLRGWLFKCQKLFDANYISTDAKIDLAIMNLEGKALQWHKIYMKSRFTREMPRWEEYVQALNNGFGSFLIDDPISELNNLRQTTCVQEYSDKFSEVLNYVDKGEYELVRCFLMGLKDEIQIKVVMFKPKTLQAAISLAKLYEHVLSTEGRKIAIPSQKQISPLNSNGVYNLEDETLYFGVSDMIGKCNPDEVNEIHKCNVLPCKEDLIKIKEPQLFDKMPTRKLIGEQLQAFDELPKSDHINKEPLVFEEMPEKENPKTEAENYKDFLKNEAKNYMIKDCPNILCVEPQDLKKESNEMGQCSKLKMTKDVINFQELNVFHEMPDGNIVEKGIEWQYIVSCSSKIFGFKYVEGQNLIVTVRIFECLKSSKTFEEACVGSFGGEGMSLCFKIWEQPQTPLPPPEPPPQWFVVWVNECRVCCVWASSLQKVLHKLQQEEVNLHCHNMWGSRHCRSICVSLRTRTL